MHHKHPGLSSSQTIDSEQVFLHPLPVPLTSLVGREHEVAEICTLLQRPSGRLLTLVGTGGVGKTRLGLAVAQAMLDDFEDGVCFVALAPLSDPAHVLLAIAQTLGLREVGSQSLEEQVYAALHDRHLLLLLDNFEHLLEAASQLTDLLASCPRLSILVTSRAVLHLSGEQEFAVSPLTVPDLARLPEPQALAQLAAVRLFVLRAQAIQPTFALTAANARTIAEICTRLDGLPLAIELAAARIKLLPPQALLARLSQRLQVLMSSTRDVPARQQTLRATLKWSYDLLETQEQRLFRRLSVFVGGWTLETAEAVCQTDYEQVNISFLEKIEALLDKSLLQRVGQQDEEPRFMMLETVREYGRECLGESGEREACERAHALYYLRLVQDAEPHLEGDQQLNWFVRLDWEMADIFAALGAAFTYGLYAELVRGTNAFTRFLETRGLYAQAEAHLKRAQQVASALHDRPGSCTTLYHLALVAQKQRHYAQAEAYLQEGLSLAKQLKDSARISQTLRMLGWVISRRGDYAQATAHLQEALALAKQVGDHALTTHALITLGGVTNERGDYTQAESYSQEGLAVARQSGNRKHVSILLSNLGELALQRGEYKQAEIYLREALDLANRIGYREGKTQFLLYLGQVAGSQGDYGEAERYSLEALNLARQGGDRERTSEILVHIGQIAGEQANYAQAKAYLEEALELARQIENHWDITTALCAWGELSLKQQQLDKAETAFREARDIASEGNVEYLALASYGLARIAAARGEAPQAREQGQESLAMLEAMRHGKVPEIRSWLDTLPVASPTRPRRAPAALPSPPYPGGLTAREVEVLGLVARGLTDAQVAEHLVISHRTVTTHLTSIYNKLGINSRVAAARFAIEHHLV